MTLLRLFPLGLVLLSCNAEPHVGTARFVGSPGEVKLVTVDPGHFHAGLILKNEYEAVDSTVHVYAPPGDGLESYLALVEQFNVRDENPTNWNLEVYRGPDFLERMLEEKAGNVMVVAGDNARKIDYVRRAVWNGMNVLADKPIIIYPDSLDALVRTLDYADEHGLLVNDVMTERHEITSILQRELAQDAALFGELTKGSPEEPAITKESVHHFYKIVAGNPLVRPAWFFDVRKQGEGIVDVSTHLVDLILWQAFPDEPIDFANPVDSVVVVSARTWTTPITASQFERVTRTDAFPPALAPHVETDSILNVASNGDFVFTAGGVHGKVSVIWNYENPDGGDMHYSVMRGTKADLIIRQTAEQGFRPTLYVEPNTNSDEIQSALDAALERLNRRYPGLAAIPTPDGWEIEVPAVHREGHEEHFGRVVESFLAHLRQGKLPEWERTNLLTKYYLTTSAYELSR